MAFRRFFRNRLLHRSQSGPLPRCQELSAAVVSLVSYEPASQKGPEASHGRLPRLGQRSWIGQVVRPLRLGPAREEQTWQTDVSLDTP